jgi:oligopeptidase A
LTTSDNPLLQSGELPRFEAIEPRHVRPAIERLIAENRQQLEDLLQQGKHSWESLIEPIEEMENRLNKAWSPVQHLNAVRSSDALREAYNDTLPLLSEYATEMAQNRRLFEAYRQLRDSADYADWPAERRKTVEDALLHFHLGGVDLDDADKQRYQEIQKKLSELQTRFSNNVLDATQDWDLHLEDDRRLSGLPDSARAMLQQYARQKDLEGYRITLEMPCYIAIMTYADDRELRQEVHRAFVTRASDQGVTDPRFDNAPVMEQIVRLKQEKARLLGYDNYAELSLVTKMANDPGQVIDFLQQLTEKSRPAGLREFGELESFAREQGLADGIQPWDMAYYSEKLKQHRYAISDEDLKPYFSDRTVVEGLFRIVERLYGIRIEEHSDQVERWHPDVRFFIIRNAEGETIAKFYLDLFAREQKRGGAWMAEYLPRMRTVNTRQLPIAYLTCNLTPPVGDQPALFTHDEVTTLFHEFGHGLHHMLTRIEVPEVSGINGVEWDAVELPSQFMENFCWEKEALDLMARHHETGEPLPDELFRKMLAARNFHSALAMLRQLEFALFDMRLYQDPSVDSAERIQQVLDEVRQQVSVVPVAAFNRFQNGFSHIFAGGYSAGYYSYKWAEVLSADAFAAFEEEGIFNPETGRRFLECILQQGGSRPANDSFVCFRGREPSIDALLRHNGIAA